MTMDSQRLEGVMTDSHKRIIASVSPVLIDNMAPDSVVTVLYSKAAITHKDKEIINSNRVRFQKVEKLLEKLQEKPDQAFQALIDALDRTEQSHLGDVLRVAEKNTPKSTSQPKPDTQEHLSEQEQGDHVAQPTETESLKLYRDIDVQARSGPSWSDPLLQRNADEMLPNLDIEHENISWSHLSLNQNLTDTLKDLNLQDKGAVCIINISKYEVGWLSPIDGYDVDTKNLGLLWRSLGYNVSTPAAKTDRCLTAQEIKDAVKGFTEMLKNENEPAVLVILSYGREGYIYGSDGEDVQVMELLKIFNKTKYPKIKYKNLLALIQACPIRIASEGERADQDNGQFSFHPPLSDITVGYSGFVRFLYDDYGSLYIDSFIAKILGQTAETNAIELLTKVNTAVKGKAEMANQPIHGSIAPLVVPKNPTANPFIFKFNNTASCSATSMAAEAPGGP